jgi:hypothetical protein
VLYRHYWVFLAPFDTRVGRRLFPWRKYMLFKVPYRFFLALRARLIPGAVAIRPRRDRKAAVDPSHRWKSIR